MALSKRERHGKSFYYTPELQLFVRPFSFRPSKCRRPGNGRDLRTYAVSVLSTRTQRWWWGARRSLMTGLLAAIAAAPRPFRHWAHHVRATSPLATYFVRTAVLDCSKQTQFTVKTKLLQRDLRMYRRRIKSSGEFIWGVQARGTLLKLACTVRVKKRHSCVEQRIGEGKISRRGKVSLLQGHIITKQGFEVDEFQNQRQVAKRKKN